MKSFCFFVSILMQQSLLSPYSFVGFRKVQKVDRAINLAHSNWTKRWQRQKKRSDNFTPRKKTHHSQANWPRIVIVYASFWWFRRNDEQKIWKNKCNILNCSCCFSFDWNGNLLITLVGRAHTHTNKNNNNATKKEKKWAETFCVVSKTKRIGFDSVRLVTSRLQKYIRNEMKSKKEKCNLPSMNQDCTFFAATKSKSAHQIWLSRCER